MIERSHRVKFSGKDKLFYTCIDIYLFLSLLVVIYPIIYIISSSFSSASAVSTGRVVLWPVEFSLEGYEAVFKHDGILTGYMNSLFYAVVGTSINMLMTILSAYVLSRKNFPFKKLLIFLFVFSMLFDGGLIPHYMLNSSLNLVNTRWVMLIPGAISIYNLIIAKNFFETNIPYELYEAAEIDGSSHIKFLYKIAVPLSKSIIAVLVLFYAITHWNSYFNAFIYLSDEKLYPLQIVLRDILVTNSVDSMVIDPEAMAAKQGLADLLKYSLIIVASVPCMIVYPFVQKHFVKGALIGSVKG